MAYDDMAAGTPMQWEFIGHGGWPRGSALDTSEEGYWPEMVTGDLVSDFHYATQREIADRGVGEVMVGLEEAANLTQGVIERMRDEASPPTPQTVVRDGESLPSDFDEALLAQVVIVGAVEAGHAAEDAVEMFPVTMDLYRHFHKRDVPVRLDTPETYEEFRAVASPDLADLRARMARLEDDFRAHVSDPRAHQQVAGEIEALADAERDKRVPLQLPAWMEGTWDCWREGDVVCCSLALPGKRGEVRICTSLTPVGPHVFEVARAARVVGAGDLGPYLGVLPTVAAMRAGGSLLPRMAAAAPALIDMDEGDEVLVGTLVAMNHPSRAALMALLQRAQFGDPQARDEWEKLAAACAEYPVLCAAMAGARDRLIAAQV